MVCDTKLYDTLGVSPTASADDIKKAYRKGALRWHPDRHQGKAKEEAEEKFKELQKAHEVLSNADTRHAYDQFGEGGAATQQQSGGMPANGFQKFHAPQAFGGRTFIFRTSNGDSNGLGGMDPSVLERMFSGFGGGFRPGAPMGADMDIDEPAGSMPFATFGTDAGNSAWHSFGMQGPGAHFGKRRRDTDGDVQMGGTTAGPFVVGHTVCATGLQGAAVLNGKRGTVVGSTAQGRIVVNFDSEEKALRVSNLRAVDATALTPGAVVYAEGLVSAAQLNGQPGTVVGPSQTGGRIEVRFAAGVGVKALLPANLRPQ